MIDRVRLTVKMRFFWLLGVNRYKTAWQNLRTVKSMPVLQPLVGYGLHHKMRT
jgi:hypothetical protein